MKGAIEMKTVFLDGVQYAVNRYGVVFYASPKTDDTDPLQLSGFNSYRPSDLWPDYKTAARVREQLK